ncbi:MAG TPA: TolC family protein [Cyclobacteriaceae bacterium]|nr:TolC family protein [Cyclobacteriaceae bacterium]
MNRALNGLLIFILSITSVLGQDTVLTYLQAKDRLVKKNFYLLAAHFEIDQAEAQVIQSRLYYNPTFYWNQEAYNTTSEKYLKASNQYEGQINQTIAIAGKHSNTVKLAKINLEINKVQFTDVMRSLLYDLANNYNNLAALEAKEKLYNEVLTSYQRLIAASKKELEVGAISVTEDLRIKSEYIAVKSQALDNANQKEQYLSQLRTLLQYPKDTLVQVTQKIPLYNNALVLDSLIDRALVVRPDLKVSKLYQEYQQQNLKLQRSLAVPDLSIGYDYDLGGNYRQNYNGLVLQMPLPLFNRNQGSIKEAKYSIQQSALQRDYLKVTITNQVIAAFNQYKKIYDGLTNYTDEYLNSLTQLNKNTNTYFQKRDISLLEFIDYQRIYISTNIQLIELRQQFLNSVNTLNFSVGETVIDY